MMRTIPRGLFNVEELEKVETEKTVMIVRTESDKNTNGTLSVVQNGEFRMPIETFDGIRSVKKGLCLLSPQGAIE